MRWHVLLLTGGLGVMAHASVARAQVTSRQAQLAAGISYGLYAGDAADQIPSPYGLGLGARAGYTFELPIYLGAEGNYFFGASQRFPEYGDVEGSLQIVHYGAEAGYDLGLGRSWVLRPKLGLGVARVVATLTVEGNTGEVSETGLVVTGGAALLYAWQSVFLVVDGRYTSLHIETKALADVPGINIDDSANLDGWLFSACVGVMF